MNELTIEEVLPEDLLTQVKQHLTKAEYFEYPLGGDVNMFVCDIPQEVKDHIHWVIEKHTELVLTPIATYARYNSPTTDTSFRIHSDGLINGEQPDVAAVLYLTTGRTGTGLFTHQTYGEEPEQGEEKIHTEDDGEWLCYAYGMEIENDMFIYPANKFHSRWPSQADHHRFVIVSFLKQVV